MKNLFYVCLTLALMISLPAIAAEKKKDKTKKEDKPYAKSYHYLRVREPFRVNTVKFKPSPEDTAVTGLKVSGLNLGDEGMLDGLEIGFFSACGRLNGVQFGLVSALCNHLEGLQVGLFYNSSKKFKGVQFGIVNNAGNHSGGWQFGMVNFSKKDGIQFGLLNFKKDGFLPFFPFVNF